MHPRKAYASVYGQPWRLLAEYQASESRRRQAFPNLAGLRYIRNMSDNGVIRIEKVDTSLNGADIFTKALAKESFTRHRLAIMGPQA